MNIRARIFARKITLIYFYEQYFAMLAGDNAAMISEINKLGAEIENTEREGYSDIDLHKLLHNYYGDTDSEIAYIIQQHFAKIPSEDIDFGYIEMITPCFFEYLDRVEKAVDKFAISFQFDDMDLVDRVIFVLGYIEYSLLKTPKEVMINEMIELAKRYGDDASPKLLNGIGHKVLSDIDQDDKEAKDSKEVK